VNEDYTQTLLRLKPLPPAEVEPLLNHRKTVPERPIIGHRRRENEQWPER